MKYNFWEIDTISDMKGHVWKSQIAPILVQTLEIPSTDKDSGLINYMEENLYFNDDLTHSNWMDPFKVDGTYYVIDEDFTHFYLFEVYKGCCYFDVAEHDDRVHIAVAFDLTKEQAHIL